MTVYASNMTTVLGSAAGTGNYGSDAQRDPHRRHRGRAVLCRGAGRQHDGVRHGGLRPGHELQRRGRRPTEPSPIIALPQRHPTARRGAGRRTRCSPPTTSWSARRRPSRASAPTRAPATPTASPTSTGSSSKGSRPTARRSWCTSTGPSSARRRRTISGNWTFDNTGTALADGTYTLTATADRPERQRQRPSYPYGVTIDTTPPPPPTISGIADGTVLGTIGTTTTDSTTDSTPDHLRYRPALHSGHDLPGTPRRWAVCPSTVTGTGTVTCNTTLSPIGGSRTALPPGRPTSRATVSSLSATTTVTAGCTDHRAHRPQPSPVRSSRPAASSAPTPTDHSIPSPRLLSAGPRRRTPRWWCSMTVSSSGSPR